MMKFNPCLGFWGTVCLILAFVCIAVIGFLSYRVNTSKCTIEGIINRNCYESKGKLILEQYVIINDNMTAFIYCGPVINCLTSPCDIDVIIGNQYWCDLYNGNNLYRLGTFAHINIMNVLGIVFLCIMTLFFLITSFILYINCTNIIEFNNEQPETKESTINVNKSKTQIQLEVNTSDSSDDIDLEKSL